MIKTYQKKSNPNMRRPIVKEEVLHFMRESQPLMDESLRQLEDFAITHHIPIIPRETVAYFRWMLQCIAPKKILEIGTAIGFSALLMAKCVPDATITTIERNPEMSRYAQKHFFELDSRRQITLLKGDAAELLPKLTDTYDWVFMDSAKSKYLSFLPDVLERLRLGGVVLIDDIFQGGDITKDLNDIKRNQRAIYRGLQALLDKTMNHPDLTASLLPLGDGLLLLRKNAESVSL